MANYQIKLTPADTYFFGGEKHDENLETNYFVESQPYPQQTTLLGLLRYYLLTKNTTVFNGKSITNKTEAVKLIGNSSFDFNNSPPDYGKLTSISPLYFVHKSEAYFFAPFDYGFDLNAELQLSKDSKNYNAKDHYDQMAAQKLVNAKGNKLELNSIISTAEQVGNEKADKGETKDNKFYKQFSKRLQADWSFCVDVELADCSVIADGDTVFLPFGGEKSYFKIEVKRQEKTAFTIPQNFKRNVAFLFCQSDCFVETSVLNAADFTVNSYVSFRNLQSTVQNTSKYSGLSASDDKQLKRSNRYNLIQRGSVLYFKNKEQLENVIREFNKLHCQTIGFNQIITNSQN